MDRAADPPDPLPEVPPPRAPSTSFDDAERQIDNVLVTIVEVPVRAFLFCTQPVRRLLRSLRAR